jgi:ribosome-binding protein aMBF1 (putative translation factor)
MISFHFSYQRTGSPLESLPAKGRHHAFADTNYLRRVIAHLESARKERGMSLGELTQLAGLRRGVISRAERHGVVPTTLEFKAWARALEISWEDVWRASFPSQTRQGC